MVVALLKIMKRGAYFKQTISRDILHHCCLDILLFLFSLQAQ